MVKFYIMAILMKLSTSAAAYAPIGRTSTGNAPAPGLHVGIPAVYVPLLNQYHESQLHAPNSLHTFQHSPGTRPDSHPCPCALAYIASLTHGPRPDLYYAPTPALHYPTHPGLCYVPALRNAPGFVLSTLACTTLPALCYVPSLHNAPRPSLLPT